MTTVPTVWALVVFVWGYSNPNQPKLYDTYAHCHSAKLWLDSTLPASGPKGPVASARCIEIPRPTDRP
jgi:hypothetical protein